jgi:hypothetical protein
VGVAFFILVIAVILVVAVLYVSYKNKQKQEFSYNDDSMKPTIYGHVHGAEGIEENKVGRIELFHDKVMINQVAIIPLHRVEMAEYSKVVKKEKSADGNSVNRYYGNLTIFFTDRNGAASSIRCETSKPNQFNSLHQYKHLVKEINRATGSELDGKLLKQEPYEL